MNLRIQAAYITLSLLMLLGTAGLAVARPEGGHGGRGGGHSPGGTVHQSSPHSDMHNAPSLAPAAPRMNAVRSEPAPGPSVRAAPARPSPAQPPDGMNRFHQWNRPQVAASGSPRMTAPSAPATPPAARSIPAHPERGDRWATRQPDAAAPQFLTRTAPPASTGVAPFATAPAPSRASDPARWQGGADRNRHGDGNTRLGLADGRRHWRADERSNWAHDNGDWRRRDFDRDGHRDFRSSRHHHDRVIFVGGSAVFVEPFYPSPYYYSGFTSPFACNSFLYGNRAIVTTGNCFQPVIVGPAAPYYWDGTSYGGTSYWDDTAVAPSVADIYSGWDASLSTVCLSPGLGFMSGWGVVAPPYGFAPLVAPDLGWWAQWHAQLSPCR